MRKIGLLGGSFNPVHLGHLHVAKEIKRRLNLDQVWFIPAQVNPFKTHEMPVDCSHRIKMLKLAIQDEDGFNVIDIECTKDGPSYTVDTVTQLEKMYPDDIFYLIMGDDAAAELDKWKDPDTLLNKVRLVVATRGESNIIDRLKSHPKLYEHVKMSMQSIPIVNISSTEIRKSLKARDQTEEVIPKKVFQYILDHNLYATNSIS